jgi:tetratricopeptide (TPR) repeat protein
MPKAKEAARRAIEIDDGLAEAHVSLAGIFKNYDWDWPASEREYKKAIGLNPGYATAHRMYASYLAAMGRPEEALYEIGRAQELDPFSLAIGMETAWNCCMARDYERGEEEALRTLEMEPQFPPAQSALGLAYAQKGRYEEALTAIEKARAASGEHPATLAAIAHVLAGAGRMPEARIMVDRLTDLSRQQHVSPFWLALAYTGVGEKVAALDELDKAYEQHDVILVWLGTDPRLDALRAEPRFKELLRRMGLLPNVGSARSGS